MYAVQRPFVAVEHGQVNVVKVDCLMLYDNSDSYWWLVRVLRTQEVGYIPALVVEAPIEQVRDRNHFTGNGVYILIRWPRS
jgi:hypothetical protein